MVKGFVKVALSWGEEYICDFGYGIGYGHCSGYSDGLGYGDVIIKGGFAGWGGNYYTLNDDHILTGTVGFEGDEIGR